MDKIPGNDSELENLLAILAEHPAEKYNLLPKIQSLLPWGYPPSLFVENVSNPENRILIRDTILAEIIVEKVKVDLLQALQQGEEIAERGAFLLGFFSDDPPVAYAEFSKMLDDLAQPLINKFNAVESDNEQYKIKIFIQYFFRDLAFTADPNSTSSAENYLIQHVLLHKSGSPAVICILANSIARRAGLDLPIVITAGNYLLRTTVEREIPFIDPLQHGRIITEQEHMSIVAGMGYDPSIALLHIRSHATLLQNLTRNLVQAFAATPYEIACREIRELLKGWIVRNENK